MAKSWKKLIKPEQTNPNKESGEDPSLESVQLTLDEIALQNDELSELLKERQELEEQMNAMIETKKSEKEDPRFSGIVESFKTKREKEKKRSDQKKKLEEQLAQKNKEVEKWSDNQKRLREKLALQKRLLQKKESLKEKLPERKRKKQTDSEPEFNRKNEPDKAEKKWFDTDFVRKKKSFIQEKKEELKKSVKSLDKLDPTSLNKLKEKVGVIKELKKKIPDSLELKDLKNLHKRLNLDPIRPEKLFNRNQEGEKSVDNQAKKSKKQSVQESLKKLDKVFPEFNRSEGKKKEQAEKPLRIATIRDKWEEKRTQKQAELKEKIGLDKLSDKLNELKRFDSMPGMDKEQKMDFPELKIPKISDLGKELSFDDKQKKLAENLEAKKAEKKEEERKERLKEDVRMKKKSEKESEERAQKKKERKKEKYT